MDFKKVYFLLVLVVVETIDEKEVCQRIQNRSNRICQPSARGLETKIPPLSIDCNNTEEFSVIHAMIEIVRSRIEFHTFTIRRAKMDSFLVNTFKNTTIKKVVIKNSEIKHLNIFRNLHGLEDSLIAINIRNVSVRRWSFSSGKEFQNLSRFSLNGCTGDIHSRGNVGCLSHALPDNIKVVKLRACSLTSEQEFSFRDLKNLVEISLNDNQLRTVRRRYLPRPALKLRSYDLSNNPITNLDSDAFIDMPKLRVLRLDHTHLGILPHEAFFPIVDYMNEISLSGIPLKCNCATFWMWELTSKFNWTTLTCVEPKNVTGCEIGSLSSTDMCLTV